MKRLLKTRDAAYLRLGGVLQRGGLRQREPGAAGDASDPSVRRRGGGAGRGRPGGGSGLGRQPGVLPLRTLVLHRTGRADEVVVPLQKTLSDERKICRTWDGEAYVTLSCKSSAQITALQR